MYKNTNWINDGMNYTSQDNTIYYKTGFAYILLLISSSFHIVLLFTKELPYAYVITKPD